ncbi:uncharacterized protein LOC130432718 [Triplophysa dalaica]|uniref:uncharacterized protein LOC130432718 n=1 Tax=Triplophysa dalaica TaxID=1582913 RepID=UPI0024E02842|nr:uncharacterized protein LOC130432718 [Triplophysa dalaica]
MLSEAICWILSNNYSIPYLIHLLDDFLVISRPDSIPAAHLTIVQKVFAKLGIPLAQAKTSGPSTSIEFLGINLDSLNFQASLPKEKIDRSILIASTLLNETHCSKRELLSVLGHLNFAMRIIPQGRSFVSHLLSLASSAHALEDLITLTSACQNELDAAPSVGFGGYYQGRWFAATWPPQLQELPQSLSSSALFELYPLVVATYLWGKEWSASSIIVHCDNEATVHWINKGRSHSSALMPFLRRLTRISASDQFIVTAKHVPEIQAASTRGGPPPNTSTSLFGTDIPVNHPLRSLLDSSFNSIFQAVSLRTLQTYLTAWRSFKSFHQTYNMPFPEFSLLTITSFISFLNVSKNLQASSIKGYLSGIQFFHKLIFNSTCPAISSPQTSMLIIGIQRAQPASPDKRQPITLDILTKCISTLRRGYHATHTSRTLDAMFTLAFFGFLRCSEMTTTSSFNPSVHPTISDLAVLDAETISFHIKQSKMDQFKRGHFIFIFNLQSPIQPYQTLLAYLHLRRSQAKVPSEPLFIDDSGRPASRFWFQNHLKSVLRQSGIPEEHFSSHSFRIGAATTAAQKGLSQQQIQALGRWTSEAFKSYIRTDRSLIKEAHRTLISQIV